MIYDTENAYGKKALDRQRGREGGGIRKQIAMDRGNCRCLLAFESPGCIRVDQNRTHKGQGSQVAVHAKAGHQGWENLTVACGIPQHPRATTGIR